MIQDKPEFEATEVTGNNVGEMEEIKEKETQKKLEVNSDQNGLEINFNQNINDNLVSILIEEIEKYHQQNKDKPITLYISSRGGSTDAVVAFYDYIKHKNISLITIGVSMVYSAAIIMLLAGEKRMATENTLFVIHNPKYVYSETPPPLAEEELDLSRKQVKMNRLRLNNIMKRELKSHIKEVNALLKTEEPFDAKTAKRIGLISKILPTSSLNKGVKVSKKTK